MKQFIIVIIFILPSLASFSQILWGTKIRLIDRETKQIISNIDSIIIINAKNNRSTIRKTEILIKDNIIIIKNLEKNKEFQFVFFCDNYQIKSGYFLSTNNEGYFNTLELTKYKQCDFDDKSDTVSIDLIPCLIEKYFDKKLIINSKEIITEIVFWSGLDNYTYPQFKKPAFHLSYKKEKKGLEWIENDNSIYIEFERILKSKTIIDKNCSRMCDYVIKIGFPSK